MKFTDLDLDDRIEDAIYSMRFESCTPIQEQAIPPLLEGRDLIGVAQTGTGKTAAYLLPILNSLCKGNYPDDAINCVIMSPTRELAQQIDQAMDAFSYFVPFSSVAVYGGNDGIRYEQELKGMQLGADIIVATPGRLISHLNLGNVDLSRVSFFVLDEADRMLDMGFYDDIMKIVNHLPKTRQTLLFSATMPPEIQKLAQSILRNPVEVNIAISKPAEKIDQSAYICYEGQKQTILKDLFKNDELKRVLIFVSSKQKVKEVTHALRQKLHINANEMHSDLDQKQRDEVMRNFKAGKIDVLVATDIISRGIDIDDIETVINYDVPHDVEDYVHRIGRTARANRDGRAITLVNEKEQYSFGKIEHTIGREIKKNPLPEELKEVPQYNGYTPKKQYHGKHRSSSKHKENTNHNRKRNGNTQDSKKSQNITNCDSQAKSRVHTYKNSSSKQKGSKPRIKKETT